MRPMANRHLALVPTSRGLKGNKLKAEGRENFHTHQTHYLFHPIKSQKPQQLPKTIFLPFSPKFFHTFFRTQKMAHFGTTLLHVLIAISMAFFHHVSNVAAQDLTVAPVSSMVTGEGFNSSVSIGLMCFSLLFSLLAFLFH